jgi:peptide/nickel transport system substrate-binding protein
MARWAGMRTPYAGLGHLVRVATILLLAATACTGGATSGSPPPADEHPRGGTLRLAVLTGYFPRVELDPQRAYYSAALTRCCLFRTLYSFNGRPAEEEGAEIRPDLAAGFPEVSSDGLRWTFRLREGLRYAPPFEETEIVSADLVRAIERAARIGHPGMVQYYPVIRGFADYADGAADSIVGLETPDAHTLVVELDEPVGDLAHRLSLPAAAPIPEGAAEGHDEDYERFAVASGPYMVEGSDLLDFSMAPAEQEPSSGYVPPDVEKGSLVAPGSLTLVRNPSWEPSSDGLRAAYVDRMVFVLGGEEAEFARDVDRGELDLVFGSDSAPADQVARYREDPELEGRVFVDRVDGAYYVSMNLAVQPFDDIHVRRAVSLAIDKAALLRMVSRPPYGPFGVRFAEIATHNGVDAVTGGLLSGFDPYPYDPAAARQEMRLSSYDGDGDGRCDVAACSEVLAIALGSGVVPDQALAIRGALAGLGIELDLQPSDPGSFFSRLYDRSERVPLAIGGVWVKDFPNGSAWFPPLFGAATVEGLNHSLLGATAGQLRGWGYSVTSVPNVDDRLTACATRSGSAQTECWAELDQYLMAEVVPWVPYMFVEQARVVSERVVGYSFDQSTGLPALDRIALTPGSE